MYVNVQSVLPSMFVYGDVPWSVLGFHFSVWTELYAVKFQMLHTLAHVSCNLSIIFILALR